MYLLHVLILRATTSSAVAKSRDYTTEAIGYQMTLSLQNACNISILHKAMYKDLTAPIRLSSRERVDTQAT
jgi:hypothetical protein